MARYGFDWAPATGYHEPLPPCPDGWSLGYVEYSEGCLRMSLVKEGQPNVHFYEDPFEGSCSDVWSTLDDEEAEATEDDEATWEALHNYGIALYDRLSTDAYGAAISALDEIRDDMLTAHLGPPVPEPEPTPPREVETVDLVAALRKSVEAAKERRAAAERKLRDEAGQ